MCYEKENKNKNDLPTFMSLHYVSNKVVVVVPTSYLNILWDKLRTVLCTM